MSLVLEMPARDEAQIRADVDRMRSMDTRRRLNAALGKRVEIEARRHFARRPRNKKGWPSQGFWRKRIRNATALASFDADGAEVRIADPAMNQKVFGGTIKPKEGKVITIPARREAYGRSPRTFGDELKFVPLRGRGKLVGLLVRKVQTFAKRNGGKLDVFYYCVTSVTQTPDPDALPSDLVMDTAITDETGKFFTREAKRGGRAPGGRA